MAINFKTIWDGLKIKAKSALTSDSKGELEVDNTSGKLNYHDGVSRSPIVTEDHTATLTNKSIDADTNTITNIENADIKAAAAIDATKIADGSVSNTEFQQLSSLGSAAVGISDTQTLTNKTIDADLNTITNIENADIKSGANIDLSKLSTLTASKALVSDLAGVITASSVTDAELGYVSGVTSSIQTQINSKIPSSEKGVNNGVATLDAGGKVPVSQLPSSVMTYEGTYNASTNTPTLVDGTGDAGMVYLVSVAGTQNLGSGSITFDVGDWVVYSGTVWQKSANSNAVVSVNGQTGVVVITKSSLGLGNVDNTSDATKNSDIATLTNKSLVDSSTFVVDAADATKKIGFDATGTTNTKTVIQSSQTVDRVITLPDVSDTLVGVGASQTLTNKTLTSPTISQINNGGTVTIPTGSTTLVGTNLTQTLTNKSLVDATTSIVGSADATKKVIFENGPATTGTTLTLQSSQTVNRVITFPDTSDTLVGVGTTQTLTNKTLSNPTISQINNGGTVTIPSGTTTLVGTTSTQTLTNKSLVDSSTSIVDSADNTKKLAIDVQGSTGVTTTLVSNSTFARTITLPDSTTTLVGNQSVQTLTNKTIDADSNTITNIENADIKAAANIDRTKLASGTANAIVVNNGSGVISEANNISNSDSALTLTNLKHIELQSIDDSTVTGSNAAITAFSAGGIRLTNGSLVSISNIPTGSNGQQVTIFNRTGASVSIKNDALVGSANTRILTGTGADITMAADSALTLSYDSTTARWQVVGGSGSGGGSLPTLNPNIVAVTDGSGTLTSSAITTTELNTLSGYTGVLSTDISTLQTDVSGHTTQLTDLTGKVTALEDSGYGIVHEDNFENTNIVYNNSGVSFTNTLGVAGINKRVAYVTHSSAKYLVNEFDLPVKFRNKVLKISLDVMSTSTTGNVTIKLVNQAGDITTTQQIPTGSVAITANTTNLSNTISGLSASTVNSITLGSLISGAGIPSGAAVTALSPTTGSITINQPATATASGVTLRVAGGIKRFEYSFSVPYLSTTLGYRIDYLTETNCQTVVDNILIEQASIATTSYSLSQTTFNATNWTSYTPTFTGFGTPTGVEFEYRQVGENYEIRGKFVAGTTTATEARISLPTGATSAGTSIIPSLCLVGSSSQGDFQIAIEPSVTYMTLSDTTLGNINKANASTVVLTGNTVSFFASVPVSGLTASTTTTTTIPLTTAQLVQQSDSQATLQGYAGLGSTRTHIPYFTNIRPIVGTALRITNDSVNGLEVTALEDGYYNINLSGSSDISVNTYFGIGKNLTDFTTAISGRTTDATVLKSLLSSQTASTRDGWEMSWSGPLNAGDKVYPMADASIGSGTLGFFYFTVSKAGSLKQLNTSSDAKITIPTHSLRFEGASTRGSTDTAIVKFDTQAITQGDAWTVTNTAANGTVVTMKKAGKLNIYSNLKAPAGNPTIAITLNQTTLTAFPSNAEVKAMSTLVSSSFGSVSTSIDVVVGDIIRIVMDAVPATDSRNCLQLSLTETSIPANFSNVLPQWSQSDSCIQLRTANGYGSTNTKIRRFSNTVQNLGSDVGYFDDASLGAYFVINSDGIYSMTYTEVFNAASHFGITLNDTQGTTGLSSTTAANILAQAITSAANQTDSISAELYLPKGSVIRCHTEGDPSGTNGTLEAKFTISKIGKPNLTSVDVTPFVNMKTTDFDYLSFKALGSTMTDITAGEFRWAVGSISTTNKGIISIQDDSANTRTKFVAMKDCQLNISFTATLNTAGNVISIFKNGSSLINGNSANVGGQFSVVNGSLALNSGDFITISSGSALGSTDNVTLSIVATADNNATASPTQNVSSDTMSFVFKSTAITTSDPIGTFNTYTYAANTNTATIATTAPTQTTSSMNTNGIQVFGRAANTTSTAASPARVDIFIGTGLKSKQVDAYSALAKTSPINYDRGQINSTSDFGTLTYYNETTGILTIEAATYNLATTVNRTVGVDFNGATPTSGYFVFNASKSPSLVTIPNLVQRVAIIKDVKASGTNGGSAVGTTWTARDLNTIDDPTGIVTSLAGNSITLPAGQYYVESTSPFERVGATKTRLFSTTSSTTLLTSDSVFVLTTGDTNAKSIISGYINLTSAQTIQLQYFVSSAFATYGLGEGNSGAGVSDIFSQVKITKIK